MATKKETTTKSAPKKTAPKKAAAKKEVVAETKATEVAEAAAVAGISDEILTELDDVSVPTEKAGSEAKLKQGRRALVKKMQSHDKDTGSTEVQIALLTGKITDLIKHLKDHPKDHDSRQGLLKMVGRRRRLLRFLQNGDAGAYQSLISDLKLRK